MRSCFAQIRTSGKSHRARRGTSSVACGRQLPQRGSRVLAFCGKHRSSKPVTSNPLTRLRGSSPCILKGSLWVVHTCRFSANFPPSPLGKVASPSHARRRRMRSYFAQIRTSGKSHRARRGTSSVACGRQLPQRGSRYWHSAENIDRANLSLQIPSPACAGAPLASSRGAFGLCALSPLPLWGRQGTALSSSKNPA